MKISIALATYNGESYLAKQLESFIWQTRLPDEVVISDDNSTDSTLLILKAFQKNAPFPVRLYSNDENRGFAVNFGRALEICTGNIIIFSDQDDIWLPNKIDVIEKEFDKSGDLMLFVNNAELMDVIGSASGYDLLAQKKGSGRSVEFFGPGNCMSIRKELASLSLPIPEQKCGHDNWILRLSFYLNINRKTVYKCLQHYRRHEGNVSIKKASNLTEKKATMADSLLELQGSNSVASICRKIESLLILRERLSCLDDGLISKARARVTKNAAIWRLDKTLLALECRKNIWRAGLFKRLPMIMTAVVRGHYREFSGWRSVVRDLLIK